MTPMNPLAINEVGRDPEHLHRREAAGIGAPALVWSQAAESTFLAIDHMKVKSDRTRTRKCVREPCICVLLTEIQAAVGRCFRAEYDTAQTIPARLADLLRQLEQQDGQSEQVA